MLLTTNPPSAAKEDLSVAYMMQLAANHGVNFSKRDKDFIAIDGSVEFAEADLRIQLKTTAEEKYWNDSFSYYLEPKWLKKWSQNLSPTMLVILTVNSPLDDKSAHTPFFEINEDNYLVRGRAYWIRVDDIAQEHVKNSEKGKTVSLNQSNRIDDTTLNHWHEILLENFGWKEV
ncbi:DUF4365 domain-containing protein [Corynebacterium kefirresidentii]|uniref:DUF4365 domain-containing protein n=1 Tax=Corynebacterium kefirresidentii TaxID=1979527 RepID=UPI000A3CDD4A|nr:DUF4365 domain-containing protein [Corynebacterium kefirresidentii]OUJ22366.1 hypothetical protein CBI45_09275 [Corynebacterium kefirresidentii]